MEKKERNKKLYRTGTVTVTVCSKLYGTGILISLVCYLSIYALWSPLETRSNDARCCYLFIHMDHITHYIEFSPTITTCFNCVKWTVLFVFVFYYKIFIHSFRFFSFHHIILFSSHDTL